MVSVVLPVTIFITTVRVNEHFLNVQQPPGKSKGIIVLNQNRLANKHS
jgi:hypothetical protein